MTRKPIGAQEPVAPPLREVVVCDYEERREVIEDFRRGGWRWVGFTRLASGQARLVFERREA